MGTPQEFPKVGSVWRNTNNWGYYTITGTVTGPNGNREVLSIRHGDRDKYERMAIEDWHGIGRNRLPIFLPFGDRRLPD